MRMFLSIVTLDDKERCFMDILYQKYSRHIKKIAYDIVDNEVDADDVLQVVALNIMTHIEKFEGKNEVEVESQIVIYTRNVAINRYNFNKRHIKHMVWQHLSEKEDGQDDVDQISGDIDELENIIIDNDIQRIVREKLTLLPEIYQDVLNLYYALDYSYVEISEVIGISINAVGLRLRKAKQKLLEIAGDELYELFKKD